ncbi:hypothetical protein GCM10008171_27540 [Methylopila jiangsuensis]|uniref:histidine kinase n=1 Tax=Methylopila jiangsuensis TaxID=586230 RepID=A0A9W6N4N0_9HYPH|nr:response regulator [Methylopila jiangsuensis]MDR6285113.1 PAS domain S-box-containing protein [Methylopila jiangsuensis]GLK77500.1 hypothetical protein GCM10008171_27540 [Methylopila jiangsuensis]
MTSPSPTAATPREEGSAAPVDDRTIARLERELAEARRRLNMAAEERRDVETERRSVDAIYAAYIDNTPDGVFLVSVEPDERVRIETVNRVVERALGLRRDGVRGMALGDVMPGAAAQRLIANISACVASGAPLRYEETVDLPIGERVYEVTLTPVTAPGAPPRVVGAARDLTDRRHAEEQLRQAQKMEAIGQLTGGVAHDFNNLLQVVKGNLELLAADLSTPAAAGLPAAVQRRLRDALAGAERGARLTRQLLAFSRRQPLAPKWVDALALIHGMSDMLARTLGERIEVAIDGDRPSWTALVDPTQLENAVLNLAINARDAMPEGGRLTIEVRNRADDVEKDDLWLEIAVSDTGVGMTPQVLARVYEPFFSTKPEGRGTGLGLPQVQGFIAQSNGRMEIESAPGAGAAVRLFLPASATQAVELAEPPPADARGRGERILVLEDDDDVRRAVADLVRSLGYEVTEAASTAEAGRVLADGRGFDLLLSDVVMPGLPSPPEFARAAQSARPGLKVLFMSGYAEDVVVHQGRVDADIHLIEKPYRKDALSVALRRLLDEPPAAAPAPVSTPPTRRRVLLVEDDALIAMAVADLLESLGYEVVEARNAAAAQHAARTGAPVDLALTDLGLPDMDGEDLARWLRSERPGLPIVFATGRSEFQPPQALAASGPTQVVTKPFNTRALQDALAACGL